jgi:hypothetical protein
MRTKQSCPPYLCAPRLLLLQNLINVGAYHEVKAMLRDRLTQRMVAAGEPTPTIEPAPEQPRMQRHGTIDEVRAQHLRR